MFDYEPKFKVGDSIFIVSIFDNIVSDKVSRIVVSQDNKCYYELAEGNCCPFQESELCETFWDARQAAIIRIKSKNK
jgi:hypothetical protein